MTGMTVSIPTVNFIWKAEVAKLKGMEFALVMDKTFSRTDFLLGTEYSGWSKKKSDYTQDVEDQQDQDVDWEEVPGPSSSDYSHPCSSGSFSCFRKN